MLVQAWAFLGRRWRCTRRYWFYLIAPSRESKSNTIYTMRRCGVMRTSLLTTGWAGHFDSYARVAMSPRSPRARGTSMLTEVHGNRMPPHVNASIIAQVEAIKKIFPLGKYQPQTSVANLHCNLQPIHFADLLIEISIWSFETKKNSNYGESKPR